MTPPLNRSVRHNSLLWPRSVDRWQLRGTVGSSTRLAQGSSDLGRAKACASPDLDWVQEGRLQSDRPFRDQNCGWHRPRQDRASRSQAKSTRGDRCLQRAIRLMPVASRAVTRHPWAGRARCHLGAPVELPVNYALGSTWCFSENEFTTRAAKACELPCTARDPSP